MNFVVFRRSSTSCLNIVWSIKERGFEIYQVYVHLPTERYPNFLNSIVQQVHKVIAYIDKQVSTIMMYVIYQIDAQLFKVSKFEITYRDCVAPVRLISLRVDLS